jgi:tetratricopeptide (TPR) repeat protein
LVDEGTPRRVVAMLELGSAMMSALLGDWDRALVDGPRALSAFDDQSDEVHAAHARCQVGIALLCCGRAAEAAPLLHTALGVARAHADERLIVNVLKQLVYERSQAGDLVRARAHAGEALRRIYDAGVAEREIASTLSILGEAEFLAGNVERALELGAEASVAAHRDSRRRNLAPVLLNLAAYRIAVDGWDEARAASIEVLALAPDTQRLIWRAWAMQHLAAVAILSADRAAPDRGRIADAARIVGYVDARVAVLGTPREYTEQQEYERVRAALCALLDEAETARLLTAGATLNEERAAALAQSL